LRQKKKRNLVSVGARKRNPRKGNEKNSPPRARARKQKMNNWSSGSYKRQRKRGKINTKKHPLWASSPTVVNRKRD